MTKIRFVNDSPRALSLTLFLFHSPSPKCNVYDVTNDNDDQRKYENIKL